MNDQIELDECARRLFQIARGFHFGMLATVASDGHLHARPMTIAELDVETGTLWFLGQRDSELQAEIAHDPRALVTLQGDDAYLEWAGRAELVDDRIRLHEIWDPSYALWFAGGSEDPSIVMIRVDLEIGAYWDHSGQKKLRTFLRRASNALRGKPAEDLRQDLRTHGHIDVQDVRK